MSSLSGKDGPRIRHDAGTSQPYETIGVDKLMWGSDYPHPDGVWPESEKYISEQFKHLPEDVTKKMTCENAGSSR